MGESTSRDEGGESAIAVGVRFVGASSQPGDMSLHRRNLCESGGLVGLGRGFRPKQSFAMGDGGAGLVPAAAGGEDLGVCLW